MKVCTFLVEIGTESLPSKILKKLGKDFFYQIINGFKKNNFVYDKVNWFASSFRLAVKANLIIKSDFNTNIECVDQSDTGDTYDKYINNADTQINHIVNNIKIRSGVCVNNFQRILECDKNVAIHKNLKYLLCKIISSALEKLNNYEMMRWSDIDIPFVRPVRTVTILLDTYLIPGYFFGIKTDRVLHGNRCMEDDKITLEHADHYPDVLIKNGWVIADYDTRKNTICVEIEKEARKLGGFVDVQDEKSLLEEVTSLVEWPVILSGQFNNKFLVLPREVILHIMRYDQKYFPVYNVIDGVLLPYFIFVSNTISDNYKKIIDGHENVIMPRLMDAEFFLMQDNKCRLEDYIPKLNSVLFHSRLGTLRDKSWRIEELSGWIAEKIGIDIEQTRRAGYLCKCDLMSNMVFEFPSTQGTIGMHYALRDGESEEIALAQKEHYQPRFSKDKLPTTHISCAVSIADKMDTISGIFGVKELPKGNRDPFALKRSAIGILRILMYKKLPINLFDLIQKSVKLYGSQLINATVINDIHNFMYNRLFSWYLSRGYKLDVIKAVLSVKSDSVVDIDARIQAVTDFFGLQKEENIKLNLIYKRISNILLKKKISYNEDVQYFLLKMPEEICLAMEVISIEKRLQVLCMHHRYYDALTVVITIISAVNAFFDNVIIMDENENVRINRLTLLNKVKNLFLKVADISLLQI
ncbi:glycine--tRNA ligase subunit beta [Blochmannia endosymbiont of Camponotus modoc]|uniref:glycine--tRNA ligase subunit beta n=1 Tax=Blochmannia endosymbiont of Camponotus modoc TaxID=2945587 RepID=UPI0020245594|nr:glycine--tRNA ligase subunit beta [Blochmannia endosymbiont of Camponotus modoc]URJ26167.1 glycine--tRNA ligase subunit beta [Blochmannia endosymbiont of Camponotus modoc]